MPESTSDLEVQIDIALSEVREELIVAYENFPRFRSAHEGVAIVDEEFREFRDAAYWPHQHAPGAEETEARQLAAMAVRYLVDVCFPGAAVPR
jgi:hypothetical protein